VLFAPVSGAQYRNTARVTITNHSGHLGTEFGPGAGGDGVKADFTVPESSTGPRDSDAEADIRDDMVLDGWRSPSGSCAEHFYLFWCTSETKHLQWHVTGDTTIKYMVDGHNFYACGESFDFVNTALLIERGTSTKRSSSATVKLVTPACSSVKGCTLTQGYWKQRFHQWPDEIDRPGSFIRDQQFFDSGRTWQQTLDTAPRGDAYLILADQYIAATLNRAKGAYMPENVRTAYAAAAHYFSLSPAERAATSRDQLLSWASLLDSYNNGKQGVPHCG
jgi:hypothetical protein